MKVALVYDRVNKWGGAERVLLALHRIFADAPLYTSVYNRDTARWADSFDIRTSFLQKVPKARTSHEFMAPLMPIAFEMMSFDKYDVVISLTSEAAKGIITGPKTLHICICLTPIRYIWSGYNEYFKKNLFNKISYPFVHYLKSWDKIAACRPDYIVAISETVRHRIKKYYKRDSTVIYPPVELRPLSESNSVSKKAGRSWYYLIVSRAVPYKKIDIAIEAFNKTGMPLKIAGEGRILNSLKQMAKSNIEFLGYVSDNKLRELYINAEALIFPGIEDFGIAMVEAQSFGLPIIAYRGGGAKEIVIDGKTGLFFDKQNADSLIKSLEKYDKSSYNTNYCRDNAKRFSVDNFEKNFKRYYAVKINEYFNLT